MNSFEGHITAIESTGNLSIVSIQISQDCLFKSVVLDNLDSAPHLSKGNTIKVQFKETEVILSTDENPAISLQNRVKGKITLLEKGLLLSRIVIETSIGNVVSVISTNAVDRLDLGENTVVTAMVKLNEVILAQ